MGSGFYKMFAIGVLALAYFVASAPELDSNFARLRTNVTHAKHTRSTSGDGSTSTLDGSTSGSGSTSSNSTNFIYPQETYVASNFDVSSYLHPSWGSGAIAPDNGSDPVGAFRFICGAAQIAYDDPIVFPGVAGASHLHQFYGNSSANASSTYVKLRQNGDSTCGSPVNRSGYWMPAMLDGKGHVVQPDYVLIYYKRLPMSDPKCSLASGDPQAEGNCIPIPNGMRFIFGYDMLTNTPPTGHHHFACVQGSTPVSTAGTLTELNAAPCPAGDHIEAMISAPTCWDGQHLDSPNHRDHVSYAGYGSWGYLKCDSAHPYLMPTFTLAAFYTIAAGDDVKLWHFASDEMVPGAAAGSTFHADYFEAWDETVKAMWTDNCINKHLNCSGGDLGNGLQIDHGGSPSYGWSNPQRLVAIPKNSNGMTAGSM